MTAGTVYLTLEEVLELHRLLIQRFGGAFGVRDQGLVEAALARPRSGYYTSLSEQAAALFQSLAMGHAFVDGNKRVAFAACAVFLRLNGYRLDVEAAPAETFITARLIGGRAELSEIVKFLERHMLQE